MTQVNKLSGINIAPTMLWQKASYEGWFGLAKYKLVELLLLKNNRQLL